MRVVVTLVLAAALATGAAATPGQGDDKEVPIGAAARAKHGPEPLAFPPADVGSAEDPAPVTPPPPPTQPPATPKK
jgi:hypothetical protein